MLFYFSGISFTIVSIILYFLGLIRAIQSFRMAANTRKITMSKEYKNEKKFPSPAGNCGKLTSEECVLSFLLRAGNISVPHGRDRPCSIRHCLGTQSCPGGDT